jgi:predicted glycosyltransferase
MRVLIDVGHPADFHLLRPFGLGLMARGHAVLYTCREKEFTTRLMAHHGVPHVSFGHRGTTTVGKLVNLARFDLRMLGVARRFKPDVFISHGSIYAAHAAWLMRKPHIALEDTFNREQVRLYAPFTATILTAEYDHPLKSAKVIKYPGYHELAYLHPRRFAPDPAVVTALGLAPQERFVIMRLVSWDASHDVGHTGMLHANKLKAVEAFVHHARVFITSEAPLPAELEHHRYPLAPETMHHVLPHAALVFGESATMAAEAAVLGTPGIFINDTYIHYTHDLERKYGLVYNFTERPKDQEAAIAKGVEILAGRSGVDFSAARAALLRDTIDVTAFLTWFVEHYPASIGAAARGGAVFEPFR